MGVCILDVGLKSHLSVKSLIKYVYSPRRSPPTNKERRKRDSGKSGTNYMEQHGLASVDHYIFHSQLAGAFWPRGPLPVVFSGWMLVRSLVGMWGVLALRLEE